MSVRPLGSSEEFSGTKFKGCRPRKHAQGEDACQPPREVPLRAVEVHQGQKHANRGML